MAKCAVRLAFILILLGYGLHIAPAQAQLARTFVSAANGSDANDCNRLTPCRTFQRAHDNALPGGEITVLDPGGYGAVRITKTISITNDGVGEAGILVSAGNAGIIVNAGPSDAVNLRGLTIKGIGFGGGTGIVFNSGGALAIENGALRNLQTMATEFLPGAIAFQPTTVSHLTISDTVVADNDGDGIVVEPVAAGIGVTAVFDRVGAYNNTRSGIHVVGGPGTSSVSATAADCLLVNNAHNGIVATSLPPSIGSVGLLVKGAVAIGNGIGVLAEGGAATVQLGRSVMTGNLDGWIMANFGLVQSYGDNAIDGNTAFNTPPPAIALR